MLTNGWFCCAQEEARREGRGGGHGGGRDCAATDDRPDRRTEEVDQRDSGEAQVLVLQLSPGQRSPTHDLTRERSHMHSDFLKATPEVSTSS